MSATAELTEEKVLETLKTVRFPGLTRDIVSFGFVKELAIGGGNVSFRLEITTDSPRAAEEIKRDATEKLRSLGMTFGGQQLLEATVRQLVEVVAKAPG